MDCGSPGGCDGEFRCVVESKVYGRVKKGNNPYCPPPSPPSTHAFSPHTCCVGDGGCFPLSPPPLLAPPSPQPTPTV